MHEFMGNNPFSEGKLDERKEPKTPKVDPITVATAYTGIETDDGTTMGVPIAGR